MADWAAGTAPSRWDRRRAAGDGPAVRAGIGGLFAFGKSESLWQATTASSSRTVHTPARVALSSLLEFVSAFQLEFSRRLQPTGILESVRREVALFSAVCVP